MTPERFQDLIASLTATLEGQPLDAALAERLNREYPAGSPVYEALFDACRQAVAAGWMCSRENDGIRWGRVIRHGAATHGFSVDVVDMKDLAGPHHVHPNGEIDLVMPILDDGSPGGGARFDGQGPGWKVYGPGSAHRPTVTGGRALVLYLLPQGAIEFSRAAA
ncbi:4-hydroxylaminobenzoate lyase [Azohydromonas caseinilytica]|uniref:DUF4863 family protein n=1 Tax=Azohydromonas caseinilytica TaxID=2728836 RepID=A0A848F2Z2_9BURK|nr:DUF4863 family protein [Azohydromonas caseinilytica]NML14427.1 DUF4863 family protein [Azohydromonas caseinilytica]